MCNTKSVLQPRNFPQHLPSLNALIYLTFTSLRELTNYTPAASSIPCKAKLFFLSPRAAAAYSRGRRMTYRSYRRAGVIPARQQQRTSHAPQQSLELRFRRYGWDGFQACVTQLSQEGPAGQPHSSTVRSPATERQPAPTHPSLRQGSSALTVLQLLRHKPNQNHTYGTVKPIYILGTNSSIAQPQGCPYPTPQGKPHAEIGHFQQRFTSSSLKFRCDAPFTSLHCWRPMFGLPR